MSTDPWYLLTVLHLKAVRDMVFSIFLEDELWICDGNEVSTTSHGGMGGMGSFLRVVVESAMLRSDSSGLTLLFFEFLLFNMEDGSFLSSLEATDGI